MHDAIAQVYCMGNGNSYDVIVLSCVSLLLCLSCVVLACSL